MISGSFKILFISALKITYSCFSLFTLIIHQTLFGGKHIISEADPSSAGLGSMILLDIYPSLSQLLWVRTGGVRGHGHF